MRIYEQRLAHIKAAWLVTGAAGFIGSHLAERLLALGQKVIGLDNFATGKKENLLPLQKYPHFRFVEGDIRSLDDCREACREAQYVLHQAALGSVPRSIDDPIATTAANVAGFVNMLVAARDAAVARFVYASSSAVFGDDAGMPKVEARIGRAVSPYGLSKHVDELYAAVFARCYGFDAIGLRYFNVFGPRQDANGAYPSVVPAWTTALLRGETAWLNGDGTFSRDFCYVENVVQANLLAATAADPAAANEAYNIALGGETTLQELFDRIRAAAARHRPDAAAAKLARREVRKGDLPHTRADISKARRLLGYEPAVDVKEGLEKTVAWYAEQILERAYG